MNKILEDSIPKKTTEKGNLAKKLQSAQDAPIKPDMTTPVAKKEDGNQAKQAKIKKIQQQITNVNKISSNPSHKLEKIFDYLCTDALKYQSENIHFDLPTRKEDIIELGQTIKNFSNLSQIHIDLNNIYRSTNSDDIKNSLRHILLKIFETDPDKTNITGEYSPNTFKELITNLNQNSPDYKIPETTINKVPNLFGQFFYLPTDQIKDVEKYVKVTIDPDMNTRENVLRFLNQNFRKTLREKNLLPNQFEINQFYRALSINPNMQDAIEGNYPGENSYQYFIQDYQRILQDIQLFDPESLTKFSATSPITQEYTQTIKPEEPTEKPDKKEPPKPWWKFWG